MVSPQEKPLVFESAWKKEKDVVAKEMEKLRASIQTLCRSALPLGKVMDYLQEDVDAMQRELQLWRGERQQHAEALRAEQRSVPRGAGVFGRDTTLFTRPVKIPKLYNFHSFESILGFDCKRNAGEPI